MEKRQSGTKKRAASLLTACLCCAALTACGNDSSEAEYYTSQSDRGHTESSAADTTRRTSRTESESDLIDRAESAVDSMREDITSLVREGTREVHPFD